MNDFMLPDTDRYCAAWENVHTLMKADKRPAPVGFVLRTPWRRRLASRLGDDIVLQLDEIGSLQNENESAPWVKVPGIHPPPLDSRDQSLIVVAIGSREKPWTGEPASLSLLTLWPPKDTAYVRDNIVARLKGLLALAR